MGFNNVSGDPHIAGFPSEAGVFHYTITATSTQNPPCDPITLTGTITVIEDVGEITISCDSLCEEKTTTLVVTSTIGSSYVWQKDGADLPGATSHTLPVSEAGTYTVTAISPGGHCTSVGSITLTQHETKRDTLRETICDNLLPYAWGPVKFETAGLHSDTLVSAMGCDSIVTRVLTVNANPVVELADIEVCPNVGSVELTAKVIGATEPDYTYVWSGDLTVDATSMAADQLSDTATVTIPDAPSSCGQTYLMSVKVTDGNECETTVSNSVSVKIPAKPTITTELALNQNLGCEKPADLIVSDFTVTDECAANPTVTLTKGDTLKNGCGRQLTWIATYENQCGQKADTVRVTYTWGIMTTGTDALTVCDSFKLNDSTYTESTTIEYTLANPNACGCDSVVTLTLTVRQSTHNSETEDVCDSLRWNGTLYTENGTYTYEYTNAAGCLSVDTLHLTVRQSTHNSETEDVCDKIGRASCRERV